MKVGQGVLARLEYKNGTGRPKLRPYLIVYVDDNKIKILVVSSLAGKESKLAFKTNYRLENFKPPFKIESFVKLDSCIEVEIQQAKKFKILSSGQRLNEKDLKKILTKLKHYEK